MESDYILAMKVKQCFRIFSTNINLILTKGHVIQYSLQRYFSICFIYLEILFFFLVCVERMFRLQIRRKEKMITEKIIFCCLQHKHIYRR